jgi:hypothetical protein
MEVTQDRFVIGGGFTPRLHLSCSRNDQQYALICTTPYSIYRLLHVSAVACYQEGVFWIILSYMKYKSNGWSAAAAHTAHSICISCNSEGSKMLPLDSRLLPKRVGASI